MNMRLHKWVRSKWQAVAIALALMFTHSEAQALTIQDILNMASLPEDTLISVIENATDLPEMTKADYNTLKKGGISTKVRAAISKRITDLKKKAASESQPKETTAKDKPADTTPSKTSDTTPPPVTVNPLQHSLTSPGSTYDSQAAASDPQASKSRKVLLTADEAADESISDSTGFVQIPGGQDTILAPVESSNLPILLRKFFQDAYETYTVEAEVARKYAELQNATASERAAEAELPKVAMWRSQIAQTPVSSLESCINMMDDLKPGMNTALGAALNQCIGLALHALKADGMASAYLDIALQSSWTIPDYSETLRTFFETAHRTDYTSTGPLRIKDHADDVDDSARQAFLYFVAYSLVYGAQPDITAAMQILSNISAGSIHAVRAHILQATLAIRAPEFKFKTAAEHLNTAIETLNTLEGNTAYELKNTAWLALARIAFENHAYDVADAFYRKVDINSHHLRDALLEDAWGQLLGGNFASVLALTHALHAPIFKKSWLPDLKLLEAGAYLALCRYDMADLSIQQLRETILADAAKLKAYVAETPSRDYYNQLIQTARDPQNSNLPASIYHRVLSDQTFKMLHQSIRLLSQEQSQLAQYVGYGFNAWPKLREIYTQAIEIRQQQMAVVLSQIYEKTLAELHALDISASQIAIEIRLAKRAREAECLKIVAAGGKCASETLEESNAQLQKRANEAWWNFDGEFWRDELRAYVSGVTSLCK